MSTKVRFMPTKTGRVHIVTTPGADRKNSKCPVVKNGHGAGGWGRKAGVSPEAALACLDCIKCDSHAVAQATIEASKTPAQKRAEAKEKSDATRMRLTSKGIKQAKPKRQPKAPAARRTRAGVDQMDAMVEKATMHLELAKDNGWKGSLFKEPTQVKVEVTKSNDLLRLIYADGKIIHSRVTTNGTEIKLRNSANWIRVAKGEMKPKGNPVSRRSGKKQAKEEAEVIDKRGGDRKLPFIIDQDDDVIIKALAGLMITWRNTISGNLESARVPVRSRNVRISVHPKSGDKMISFHELQGTGEHGELLGGERNVLIKRILRAK
jgi:hypothetical protein